MCPFFPRSSSYGVGGQRGVSMFLQSIGLDKAEIGSFFHKATVSQVSEFISGNIGEVVSLDAIATNICVQVQDTVYFDWTNVLNIVGPSKWERSTESSKMGPLILVTCTSETDHRQ